MTDGSQPENVLFEWYERYIGEPTAETEVYLGFGLFFGGCAFAALGLVLFLGGTVVYGLRTGGYFALAQPGYFLGMLSVPMAVLSIVVLLPTERRLTLAAYGGAGVTTVAAVAFLLAYPDQWFEFGTQNTLAVVGSYAVGVATVVAAAGSALVAHRVEQAQGAGSVDDETDGDAVETVTDEQVAADIDEAMSDVDLNWGGVEQEEHRRLEFTTEADDVSAADVDIEAEQTVSSGGVDAEVQGLKQLKGGNSEVDTSTNTVDDQTAALNELKRQKQAEKAQKGDDGWNPFARLVQWLRGS
ncbi:DUF7139 domain-containing protein [Halorientalis litorea]|jgi:hypothetical protein|uniref:DUF7139 domain-containing protein n=1 Tax=Halorientalis litorea TaxID=2931977 RepID=UPI001FF676B9|nr:hypothetical protein [Halorientalis litorea]